MPQLSSFLSILLLIFAMLIWGSSFVALKFAMKDLGEYTVIFFRMLIASSCFIYFIKDFLKYKFEKKDIKFIVLLAIFEPCLYFIFEAKALLYTSASQAGVITSMLPLITAFFAGYFLKEVISKQLLFGSLIAIIGVIWLSVHTSASFDAPDPLFGNFLEFCAMVCGTGYTIVARYLVDRFSALFITAMQAFIGLIFFFPFFLYELSVKDLNFTYEAVASLFYLGVIVTLCGYGLYNLALTKIEASKAAMFVNLIPIFTLILAFLFLGEVLSFQELVACAVILLGVILSQIKIKRAKKI